MQKVTIKQLQNLNNPYQQFNKYKRVLCVCDAGLLRSATIAKVLTETYNYNTLFAGTEETALIPITEALIYWADEIVCAEEHHKKNILNDIKDTFGVDHSLNKETKNKIVVLKIPDRYEYNNEELVKLILINYEKFKKVRKKDSKIGKNKF